MQRAEPRGVERGSVVVVLPRGPAALRHYERLERVGVVVPERVGEQRHRLIQLAQPDEDPRGEPRTGPVRAAAYLG